jgi:hypothetical protein
LGSEQDAEATATHAADSPAGAEAEAIFRASQSVPRELWAGFTSVIEEKLAVEQLRPSGVFCSNHSTVR